jgi:hypothetical protein
MKRVRISPIVIEAGQPDGQLSVRSGKLPVRGANRTPIGFEVLSFPRFPKAQTESAGQGIAPASPVPACVEVNALEGDQIVAPSFLIQIRWSLSFSSPKA